MPAADRRRVSTPTIYDVAELAGVSPSTVSRALNHPGRITPATTAKIQAAADQLGFSFNPAARALPTGKTRTLALVLADITNPIVFGIIRGAERAAAAAGYTLIIAESGGSGAPEAVTARNLLRSVDGLILAMSWLSDDEILDLADRKPLTLINRIVDGVPGVAPDVVPGIEQLLDHLAGRGHQHVTYLSGSQKSWMNHHRWNAVFDAARERDLKVFEIPGETPSIEGGHRAFERVAASPASAVMAYNDLMAIGLLQAAQERGMSVPDDLAIVGFDNMFGSTLTTPRLTTVATPLEQVAVEAVRGLVGAPSENVDLKAELIIRGTT